jgi:hypothetical protein
MFVTNFVIFGGLAYATLTLIDWNRKLHNIRRHIDDRNPN